MSKENKMTNFRWTICAMLLIATTVNYLDRQVLSLTWKDFIAPEFHWSDADYGVITGYFSLVYAICMLFAGKVVDWLGTKKGYLWAIFVWSLAACAHAVCGWATMNITGIESIAAMKAVESGSALALSVASVSVWLFLGCRYVLAFGEAGNFPAAIKVTAEYFPKKDRAFATSIFNSGASIGALAAPALIPPLAEHLGWEAAFIIIGGLGFIWMGFWAFFYTKPAENRFVNAAELAYMEQDDVAEAAEKPAAETAEKTIPFFRCFSFRQTWAFIFGKFMTDGVWWFYLFWAPGYFSDQFGYKSSSGTGMALIITLYAIVTVVSIYGCKLPTVFVEKLGMNPYEGRMRAMLIFAFFPLVALFAQPLGAYSAWYPAILIGFAAAGHQAWSANIFSTVGDMFPKSTIATVTGIGGMAGGLGGFLINLCAGKLFTYAAGTTMVSGKEVEMTKELLAKGAEYAQPAMQAFGFTGKPAGYMVVFCVCAVAYVIAWSVMKTLVPRYRKVEC